MSAKQKIVHSRGPSYTVNLKISVRSFDDCWASCTDLGFDNKQLLDEVEHDITNYQNRGLCYLPKPKAEADNTDTRF